MSYFRITGGVSLRGEVEVGGSKNAALPIMAASILADEPVRLRRVPWLTDTTTLAEVLQRLGMRVARQDDGSLELATVDAQPVRAPYELVRRMRASFCVLGPLLARRGRAVVSLPGGCNLGDRPVDLHLKGLAALGAQFRLHRGYVVARAARLRGTTVDLRGPQGPTVTGTANVLSAAVLAEGETTINGAACEPEIVQLGEFLVGLGARIEGLGTSTVRVEGVRRLHGGEYTIAGDRIEAATLLLAAAITRGSATVRGVVPSHLSAVVDVLRRAGCGVETTDEIITLAASNRTRALDVTAQPYPGIPTDVQAQLTALATVATGRSTIRDHVFPHRFMHVAEMKRLGARISLRNSVAMVDGVPQLAGAPVTACDLRASAALVLAGLAAEGQTIVREIHHLDRGYERLDEKLQGLGAEIERVHASGAFRHHAK